MIQPAVPDPPELDGVLWRGFATGGIGYDIGANCGQTVDLIHEIAPDMVVAFEPAIEALEYLEEHIVGEIRRPWLVATPFAVSDTDDGVELVAAPSKISTGQLVTHGTEGMEWSEEEMKDGVIRKLSSITLDTWVTKRPNWGPPSFMKIDVEGHELAVLRGATAVLEQYKPQMLIEIHSEKLGEDIQNLLSENYHLDLVRHPHYEPGSLLWRTHFWLRCFPK